MANRLFDLPETKGKFEVQGVVNGVEKENFYISKKTRTNKDFRRVNFGCAYDEGKSVYIDLNGMPQNEVYFSKRNQDGKTETKKIPWANRNTFNADGFRMIGVNIGITKKPDDNGKLVNDKKVMHAFDACNYIKENLKDDVSVFTRGNIEFSSFTDAEGNIRRGIKYVPNQISLCQDVDFSAFDYDKKKPRNNFTQTILFKEIEPETDDNGNKTGRFVVNAQIVTWSDIVSTEFIITESKLAGLFRKNLKPYTAIDVYGRIEVSQKVETVVEEDCWGEANEMDNNSTPFKTELVIVGAKPATIDKETYTEKNVSEALSKIKNAKKAEQNFADSADNSDEEIDWGDDSDDDVPWGEE